MVPIVPYPALLATLCGSSPPASHPLELGPDTLRSPPGALETQRRRYQKRKVLTILTTHPGLSCMSKEEKWQKWVSEGFVVSREHFSMASRLVFYSYSASSTFCPGLGASQCPSTCRTCRAKEVEFDANSLLVSNSGKNKTT